MLALPSRAQGGVRIWVATGHEWIIDSDVVSRSLTHKYICSVPMSESLYQETIAPPSA